MSAASRSKGETPSATQVGAAASSLTRASRMAGAAFTQPGPQTMASKP